MKFLLALLLFVSTASLAQVNDTSLYIRYKDYGRMVDRYQIKKVLVPPQDTGYSKYGIAIIGTTLYIGNGAYWTPGVGGGVGSCDTCYVGYAGGTAPGDTILILIKQNGQRDTIPFSNKDLYGKVDSVKVIAGNIWEYKNGDSTNRGAAGGGGSGIAYTTTPSDSVLNFHYYNGTDTSIVWRGAGSSGSAISLTTTGISGVATYNNTTKVLNIPVYNTGGNVVISDSSNLLKFDPKSVPGMNAWYDAQDYKTFALENDTSITQWDDKSDSLRHLTQATTANKPIYRFEGGSNSQPYVEFSSTQTISKTGIAGISQPYTLYMVISQSSFVSDANLLQFGSTGTNGLVQRTVSGRNMVSPVADVNWYPSTPNAYKSKWILVKVTFNGVSSLIEINDELQDRVNGLSSPGTSGITRITFNGATKTSFKVAELIIYAGVVSYNNDQSLRKYFIAKYALTTNELVSFFGDSITAGTGASNETTTSFAALVSIEKDLNIYNFGISGTSVYKNASTSLAAESVRRNLNNRGYIVLSYGSNDAPLSSDSAYWRSAYKSIVQRFINMGVDKNKIIICTQPYSSTRIAQGTRANTIEQSIATELGVKFADAWSATLAAGGDALLADGLHPNDAGHRVMADVIEAFIQ